MRTVLLTTALAMLALPVQASEAVAPAAVAKLSRMPGAGGGCMQENANININFNFRVQSFADAKVKFDEKMKQIEEFARQQQVKKFEMQSMNYNINTQVMYENGTPEQNYQLSGSASYQVDSADTAFKLGEFLTQQKIQVNISVNKYRNGACNNPGMMVE